MFRTFMSQINSNLLEINFPKISYQDQKNNKHFIYVITALKSINVKISSKKLEKSTKLNIQFFDLIDHIVLITSDRVRSEIVP